MFIVHVHMAQYCLFPIFFQIEKSKCLNVIIKNNSTLWHHLIYDGLSLLCKKNMATGIPRIFGFIGICENDIIEKQQRKSFKGKTLYKAT